MRSVKNSKQLERHFKGVANHWRIEIIRIVRSHPGITVDGIADIANGNFKTISEHTRRLVHAGLISKEYSGRSVAHSLSPYGKIFVRFIETFQHS